MENERESKIPNLTNRSERNMVRREQSDIEKPPIFKSWKTWYISLLIYLAALIAVFYLFTKAFE